MKMWSTLSSSVKGGGKKKKNLDSSLYQDPHQKSLGSILGRDPSSIKVSWKSVK